MRKTIFMDASGRLVLPKVVRERLNLRGGSRFSAAVVAGHIELVPVATEGRPNLRTKAGMTVIASTGKPSDAAAAVVSERQDQEARGTQR